MALRYNSDTDSVRYLTTSEGNPSSNLQTYGNSMSVRSILSSAGRHLRQVSWERVLLLLAVTLSILSFTLSAIMFFERGGMNTEAPKGPPVQDFQNTSQSEVFVSNVTELPSGSGEGENQTEKPPTLEAILKIVSTEFDRREGRMMDAVETEMANYTEKFGFRTLAMFKELEALRRFRGATKTEVNALRSSVNEISRKQNDTWKYLNDESDFRKSSAAEMMGMLNAAEENLAKLHERVTNVSDTEAKTVPSYEYLLYSEIHGSELLNFTVHEIEDRVDDMEQRVKIAQEKNAQILKPISDKVAKDSLLILHHSDLLKDQNVLITTLQANMTNLARQAFVVIQQVKNDMHRRLGSATNECTVKISQAETRLNSAIQNIKASSARTAQQLGAATRTANRLSTYESSMKRVNTSLNILTRALKGKSDKGWVPAPNGYAYHITLTLFGSWANARTKCQQLGGSLAYIGPRDSHMHNFLFLSLVEPRGESAWIGLTDLGKEGTWKWIDGVTMDYSNWANGQPNNVMRHNSDQDCAEMYVTDGMWNDGWCDRKDGRQNAALCERKV